MNDVMVEGMVESNVASPSGCPLENSHGQKTTLDASDELVLFQHKRVISQYSTDEAGITELHLYYGDKEICFDDPELFAFGEGLIQQPRFKAGTATTWGEGYDWPRVQELLEQLIDEGILQRAQESKFEQTSSREGAQLSPLPPAQNTTPRTWFECEEITRELTGQPLEMGYLELVIPIFRIAHMAMDADGRQVGEANVFPQPLRLDVPTEWRSCPHVGSRYNADRPMNVTALKTMRKHWPQMMAALLQIRAAFLRRFPRACDGWTVGDLERLSVMVLALPTYLLMRAERRVENGHLHPVLSSLFRVTDGLRMTMHQMLFLPVGEPTRPADAPMTSAEAYAYAERNYVFFSAHGVCAGPKTMVEEFLNVLIDGRSTKDSESIVFDPDIQAALDDLDQALDYGLLGLQAHSVVFSLWPVMSRAYVQLESILENWTEPLSAPLIAFRQRFEHNLKFLRNGSLLATEEWRSSREHVYANMYTHCALGLGEAVADTAITTLIAPSNPNHYEDAATQLLRVMRQRFGVAATGNNNDIERLTNCLMDYFSQEQAIVRAASEIQQRVNQVLGRTSPSQPFTAAAIDIYNQLQGDVERLPYLASEIETLLGLRIVVTPVAIEIFDRIQYASAS